MELTNIAIFGAGGFGREVKMLINQINQAEEKYRFVGFFDDGIKKGTKINGYEVLGDIDDINTYKGKLGLVISIANPKVKHFILSNIVNEDVFFPTLIHPSCYIGNDNVVIGEGSIICAGTIITVDINIGAHVILNLSCTVGHDTNIGKYSSFMPSVNISGEVEMGDGVYCGTGAKIINQLTIGAYTIIGAGAVVSKSLPGNCTAVGVPAKVIKTHE
jgi:sugar O-acyltransferase (sialic acid O-acetyltransferase NeuD family)